MEVTSYGRDETVSTTTLKHMWHKTCTVYMSVCTCNGLLLVAVHTHTHTHTHTHITHDVNFYTTTENETNICNTPVILTEKH